VAANEHLANRVRVALGARAVGVGINLTVQDAVAAANVRAEPLKRRAVTEAVLAQRTGYM